ncbi:MAG: hypothetical protein ACJ8G3_15195 [Burkholderiaceae bacterium]
MKVCIGCQDAKRAAYRPTGGVVSIAPACAFTRFNGQDRVCVGTLLLGQLAPSQPGV